MFFNKAPHRSNFAYPDAFDPASGSLALAGEDYALAVQAYEGDVYHLRLSHPQWGDNRALCPLEPPAEARKNNLQIDPSGTLTLGGPDGQALLKSVAGRIVGVSDRASIWQFEVPEEARFYGMGQKFFGKLELSGKRAKFWNTDVLSDFPQGQWLEGPADPPYFTTPYLIVKVGGAYLGLLLDNPSPAFMETPGSDGSRIFVEWQRTAPHLILGNEDGEPNLWILVGPSLRELTRKLQALVGRTPLPPIWSLGYHQSRYGYGGEADLRALHAKFDEHQIPCDALWLDLDYMDGFRVFKPSDSQFPNGVAAAVEAVAPRRVVPILDPGVKQDPGYPVYDDGRAKGVFCRNPVGGEFVGMVWPGDTVFPDFTTEEGRAWWSGHAAQFRRSGFQAAWIDMNDPSTGPVDPSAMRFRNGADAHALHRNQYGLGMAMATRAGFLQAQPDERPFVLSRSGFTGSSRFSAIWSGDNWSNRFYLRLTIPVALGMSLSGLPFNGADLGGFGGDCDDTLLLDWLKANFLFPFLRNHTMIGTRAQEPWAGSERNLHLLRRYIRLRYKLLPYLYQLFAEQEERGDPILRPLFYEFDDPDLDAVDDQFLVGPYILQAPILEEGATSRIVVLPGDQPWYDARDGGWLEPGEHRIAASRNQTPLFVRAGAILPMRPGTPTQAAHDLRKVRFHLFVPPTWTGESATLYRADDGLTLGYQRGQRTLLEIGMSCVEGALALSVEQVATGFGALEAEFVLHGEPAALRVNGTARQLRPGTATLTGKPLPVSVVGS